MRTMRNDMTFEEARTYFDYDPRDGKLRWRQMPIKNTRAKVGDVVGSKQNYGYLTVRVRYVNYLVHRVIWLWVHGEWPDKGIDHINGKPDDNRLKNLRLADQTQNLCNACLRKNSRSGLRGVHWHGAASKWTARIQYRGAVRYLGLFTSKEAAHQAYLAASKELHGDYARAS